MLLRIKLIRAPISCTITASSPCLRNMEAGYAYKFIPVPCSFRSVLTVIYNLSSVQMHIVNCLHQHAFLRFRFCACALAPKFGSRPRYIASAPAAQTAASQALPSNPAGASISISLFISDFVLKLVITQEYQDSGVFQLSVIFYDFSVIPVSCIFKKGRQSDSPSHILILFIILNLCLQLYDLHLKFLVLFLQLVQSLSPHSPT